MGFRCRQAEGPIHKCIDSLPMITWTSRSGGEPPKHKIDLADWNALRLPDGSVEGDRERYGELRAAKPGMWRGRVVFLVWTSRGATPLI